MHIYLVEVESYARRMVVERLRSLGHRVSVVAAPADLVRALAAQPQAADLVVADLPPGRGRAISEALRRVHGRYPTIPVLLRATSERLPAEDALHCGVHGYLSKPFRPEELELLLTRLRERRASLSFQDQATGLYLGAGFAVLARQQLRAAGRTGTEIALLRVDVAGTERKHTEGTITHLGRVLRRTFRDADIAGRVDGTDCGVLLVNAGTGHVDIALRRLEQNLATHNAGATDRLNVRVGVAHFDPGRPRSLEDLMAEADAKEKPPAR